MKTGTTTTTILNLPRVTKRLVVLATDASLCVFTVWLAFYLRLGDFVSLSGPPSKAALYSIALALPIFMIGGLYRAIFRYSGWPAFMAITRATGTTSELVNVYFRDTRSVSSTGMANVSA